MSNTKSLTTKEVARLCSVSDATVKRWAEAGLLQSERTSGGHRRFRPEEVARFQREIGLGLRHSLADESVYKAAAMYAKRGAAPETLFDALIGGREDAAANMLINAFLDGAPLVKIFDEMLTDAMHRVGDLWFEGELTVAQEHLATRTALSAVHRLRELIPAPEPNGLLAMCCAMEGEYHEMATHLAQMTLESSGWEVLNFSANTPLYSLAERVIAYSPRLVCISATILFDIERAARDYREMWESIDKRKISVALGGQPFRDERVRRRFPANLYAGSFTQLLVFANQIVD